MGLIFHVGLIDYHIHQHFRVIHRSEPAEGNHIIPVSSGQLLRRSRLSSQLIPFHLGRFSRSLGTVDRLEQGVLDKAAGRLGNRLPHQHRIHFFYHRSLGIENLLHHMRLIVGAAIDHGTVGSRHLNHGAVVVLSKGVGGHIHRSRRIHRISQAAGIRLSRKIDSRLFREAEHILIFIENFFSFSADNLHKHIVAGNHKRFRHRQVSMAAHTVYAPDIGAGHILASVAEKGLVSVYNTLFHSRRDGEYLGWGTGLVGIAHAVISPLLIPGLHLLLLAHGGNLFLRVAAGEISGIIQIIHPVRGHGQNLSRIRIHHHHPDIFRAGSGHPLVNVFLHHLLNIQIDGGHHSASVYGRLDHRLQIGVVVEIAVFPAVGAGEYAVVGLLDSAVSCGSVAGGKAQNGAGRLIIGIIPLILLLEPDTVDPFFLLGGIAALGKSFVHLVPGSLKILFLIHCQLSGITDVGTFRIFQNQVGQLCLIIAEGVGQSRRSGIQILVLAACRVITIQNLRGFDDHVVHLVAHRQIGTVAVHNVSPFIGNGPAVIAGMLAQHNLAVFHIVFFNNIIKHQNQCKQSQRNHQNGDRQLFLHISGKNPLLIIPMPAVSCSSGCLHFVLYTRFLSDHTAIPDPCRHKPCPALLSLPYKYSPGLQRC